VAILIGGGMLGARRVKMSRINILPTSAAAYGATEIHLAMVGESWQSPLIHLRRSQVSARNRIGQLDPRM